MNVYAKSKLLKKALDIYNNGDYISLSCHELIHWTIDFLLQFPIINQVMHLLKMILSSFLVELCRLTRKQFLGFFPTTHQKNQTLLSEHPSEMRNYSSISNTGNIPRMSSGKRPPWMILACLSFATIYIPQWSKSKEFDSSFINYFTIQYIFLMIIQLSIQ